MCTSYIPGFNLTLFLIILSSQAPSAFVPRGSLIGQSPLLQLISHVTLKDMSSGFVTRFWVILIFCFKFCSSVFSSVYWLCVIFGIIYSHSYNVGRRNCYIASLILNNRSIMCYRTLNRELRWYWPGFLLSLNLLETLATLLPWHLDSYFVHQN